RLSTGGGLLPPLRMAGTPTPSLRATAPPPWHGRTYSLEYGSATLEIPAEGIALAGRRVAIVDDVLATGGTVAAANDLLATAGATVTAAAVIMELAALGGRDRLAPLTVHSLQLL
nr:phosphoribosyltransferase family protein [Mycobacterium sp.]